MKFKCGKCDKRFGSPQGLGGHTARGHNGKVAETVPMNGNFPAEMIGYLNRQKRKHEIAVEKYDRAIDAIHEAKKDWR